jgi:diguanylate cyclase (GGDEF)-like protein
MQQQLTVHARTSQRHQSIFSVLLIDLDFFKKINDNYGHQVGDEALIHASQCFKQVLREIDWLSRYGGEEFLVLLPETNLHGATLVAERIQKILATKPFTGTTDFPLTASIGVASYHPGDNIDQLIATADKALYQAKAQGRNQICTEDNLQTTNNSHQTNAAEWPQPS